MKAHEYVKFPTCEVEFKLNSDDLSVILDCLLNVHSALLKDITREETSAEHKKKAYDFAYQTEVTYDNIMSKKYVIPGKPEESGQNRREEMESDA